MKILFASTYVTSDKGGAEKVAWDMARFLSKSNEVHVLTLSKKPEKFDKIKVHTIPDVPKPTIYYSTFGQGYIKKITSKYNFDIIHSHMPLPWGFIFRNAKSKKIITMHGCEYLSKDLLYKPLAKIAFKKTDLIISPSYWLRDFVKKNYGYDSMVISNSIDTKKFNILKNVKKEKKVILFVGRLIKIKGVLELLKVAKELKTYEFWFAGDGHLKKLITLPNTEYLGYFNEDKLIQIYNKATICVFPSYKENFPLVGLEALACGKAIIATKTGFSEIIDNNKNGLLINPKNPRELESAIIKLMKNQKLRKKFERNARKKALQFDYKRIMGKYYSLYKNLLKNKNDKRRT